MAKSTEFKIKLNGFEDWAHYSTKFIDYASRFPYMRNSLQTATIPDFDAEEQEKLEVIEDKLLGESDNEAESSISSRTRTSKPTAERAARKSDLKMKVYDIKIKSICEDTQRKWDEWRANSAEVLGVLFDTLSYTVIASLQARHPLLEEERRREELIPIWSKIVAIYSVGDCKYPEWTRLEALSMKIDKAETLPAFLNRREKIFGELKTKKIEITDSEMTYARFIWRSQVP
jgi:hypothetical protein